MRPAPQELLDPRAVLVWRIEGMLRALLFGVLLAGMFGSLMLLTPVTKAASVVVIALWVAGAAVQVLVLPKLRYRYFRYRLTEHELDVQRGVFVIRRSLIPLVRVQHVDTVQGPLSKQFGLTSVTVSTAAGAHSIPALSQPAADALRDRIAALARVARETV